MKLNKCPHCGASVTTTENNKLIQCQYCNSTYENVNFKEEEKPVENNPQVVNNYYGNTSDHPTATRVPRRPRFRFIWAFILFCFNPMFALIYLIATKSKQKSWDDKYTY